ncbi:WD40-repeat-containing domain protein [Chytridium lagenaria]|nr:WD40-repeat-containing domain protein [Chytridium lagenaria]
MYERERKGLKALGLSEGYLDEDGLVRIIRLQTNINGENCVCNGLLGPFMAMALTASPITKDCSSRHLPRSYLWMISNKTPANSVYRTILNYSNNVVMDLTTNSLPLDFEITNILETLTISDLPVRAAKFIARKTWLITGSDDKQIRVFNYQTHEKVVSFEAHQDYIRCIAVHHTQPYILTSSDDMSIKLWDWEKNWSNIMTFHGHTHFVMQVVFNPTDGKTFASASLDHTIKVWSLGSAAATCTLEGHEKGINCIDYYHGGDKSYLVSGSDDKLVKVWDYQTNSCVQTLAGHTGNVNTVAFHPKLPLLISGSDDGTVRTYHTDTYGLENIFDYGMKRVWTVAYQNGSNDVAFGYDEGAVAVKLGKGSKSGQIGKSNL